MKKKKPVRQDEDEDYYFHGVPIYGIGSYDSSEYRGEPINKTQIGFIRQEKKIAKKKAPKK